jgi:putative membrane protein
MRIGLFAAGLAGLFLATMLVAWFGLGEVAGGLAAAGWRGIAAIAGVHLASILLCAAAWRVVLPTTRPSLATCVYARWVREAVGNLLGVLPVAGEIVGARLLVMAGLSRRAATASVVVDLVTESVSQAAFTLLGLVLLIADKSEVAVEWSFVIVGAAIPALSVVLVTRSGRALSLVERAAQTLARSLKVTLAVEPCSLAETVHEVFRQRSAVAASFMAHLLAWLTGGIETWLALRFMGHPIGLDSALIVESLVWAIRGAVFVVPSGIGIQEGGTIVVGALFGLSPEIALALSLVKRARDLVLGTPALVLWQLSEGGRIRRALYDRIMHNNS